MLIRKNTLVAVTTKTAGNIHKIKWPTSKVVAISTTRLNPLALNRIHSLSERNHTEEAKHSEETKLSSDFDYFNLGDHVGDCAEAVASNRDVLLNFFPKNTDIQWLEQVHGSYVAEIEQHNVLPIVADAAITRQKRLALAIMTADCLPILLADKNGTEIAAIHAGWRPLADNIIEKTINKMHTPAKNICAWLGPCIGWQAFEVGEEVKHKFIGNSEIFAKAFIPTENDIVNSTAPTKYLADIMMIASMQLEQLGIEEIANVKDCTYTNANKYYSFRRDGRTGRMASVICIT